MKSLILLGLISLTFAAQSLDFTKQCVCTDYKVSSDCTSDGCVWESSACRAKKCSDNTTSTDCGMYSTTCKWDTTCKDYTVVCSDFTTAATCDALYSKYNCAWNNACAAFTKCSDYLPGTTGCGSKSSSTQICQATTAGTSCENATPTTCASFTSQATCTYSSTSPCIWDTSCSDLTACTQLKAQTACTNYSSKCTWSTTCNAKTCADNTTEATCTYLRGFNSTTGTLCKWDATTTKCADAADASALTSTTCRTNTGYTFFWEGYKCNQCGIIQSNSNNTGTNSTGTTDDTSTGKTTSGLVLGMIVSLLVLSM